MTIDYLSSTWSDNVATSIACTFHKIASSLLTSIDLRVQNLDTLSARDLMQIWKWNKSVPEKVNACVHLLFQQRAVNYPDAPAVCSWDGDLTYGELDRLSSKLARLLCSLGAGPEKIVPFCFEKSFWAVVAAMAILKSGSAFVALDPSNPRNRSESIIHETGARLLVTSPSQVDLTKGLVEDVVVLSSSFMNSLEESAGDLLVEVGPQNAAFVLFTSGSTGKPKGIIQDHAAVCTMCMSYGEALFLDAGSRVLQFAAYNFDVSIVDIVDTLIHGACLCIPSEYERRNNTVDFMNRARVNWADLTPSFATTFIPDDVPSLKTLVLAGEEVKQEHVARWAGKVRLINCYGPAESSACTAHVYLHPHSQAGTIGRAMAHAICWVSDVNDPDRLTSIGAIGELVVESPALARGYLNNPEKTNAAFIENPQWLRENGVVVSKRRLYKTGDLVRYQSDGSLRFIGRKDTQIKIRGQRVELSEAEHHLSTYPDVAKSLIAFPKSGEYAKRLVAVVQLRSLTSPSLEEDALQLVSRTQLQSRGFGPSKASEWMMKYLPAYMIPTAWFVVESIPLTSSKKMDRKRVEIWLGDLSPTHQFCSSAGDLELSNLSPIPPGQFIASKLSSMVAHQVAADNTHLRKALEGHDFSLSAVGIDSIQVMTLSRSIQREFAVGIGVERLTNEKTTIQSLAEDIESVQNKIVSDGSGIPKVDILREVDTLHDELLSVGRRRNSGSRAGLEKVENVLVTGATGFLGTHILKQLLSSPGLKRIIAHVRAEKAEKGLQRVIDAARSAGWWSDHFSARLEVWPGDLIEPRIGLTEHQWDCLNGGASLEESVQLIIHSGGAVRWNADYSTLKPANVLSTFELLGALATSPLRSTRLVYISGGQLLNFDDDDQTIIAQVTTSNGYAHTKLVSELLVKKFASSHNGQISIVKPSFIIGTPEDGIANMGDYIWRLVAGAIDIQAHPTDDNGNGWLFISDVDRIAHTITTTSLHPPSPSSSPPLITKILDGLPMRDFWSTVSRDCGYNLEPVRVSAWWTRLRDHVEASGPTHVLWPLLYMLEPARGTVSSPGSERGAAADILGFVGAGDGDAVAEASPAAGRKRVQAALTKNIEYLQAIGFIPRPGPVA